ncbi:hypothetical protein MP228_011996 [Amoeboaphelidium protococcarum]|nr:hypothetical protein MP228_011996 [Amoeboaphelidium protococcarum]
MALITQTFIGAFLVSLFLGWTAAMKNPFARKQAKSPSHGDIYSLYQTAMPLDEDMHVDDDTVQYASLGSLIDAENVQQVPPGFKIAMIADTGLNVYSERLWLKLRSEKVDLVLHPGDFAYRFDEARNFASKINQIFPPDQIPYVTTTGDHDIREFLVYRNLLVKRDLQNKELQCEGKWGYFHVCTYRGIVMVGAGLALKDIPKKVGENYAALFHQQLKRFGKWQWKFCFWHRNANRFQVGGKKDGISEIFYDVCKEHGATIVTGHQHTYSRTLPLTDFKNGIVSKDVTMNPLNRYGQITRVFPGQSFCIVTGLSGAQPRNWIAPRIKDDFWVSVLAKQNFQSVGGLTCTLNDDQQFDCDYRDLENVLVDKFTIVSENSAALSGYSQLDPNDVPRVSRVKHTYWWSQATGIFASSYHYLIKMIMALRFRTYAIQPQQNLQQENLDMSVKIDAAYRSYLIEANFQLMSSGDQIEGSHGNKIHKLQVDIPGFTVPENVDFFRLRLQLTGPDARTIENIDQLMSSRRTWPKSVHFVFRNQNIQRSTSPLSKIMGKSTAYFRSLSINNPARDGYRRVLSDSDFSYDGDQDQASPLKGNQRPKQGFSTRMKNAKTQLRQMFDKTQSKFKQMFTPKQRQQKPKLQRVDSNNKRSSWSLDYDHVKEASTKVVWVSKNLVQLSKECLNERRQQRSKTLSTDRRGHTEIGFYRSDEAEACSIYLYTDEVGKLMLESATSSDTRLAPRWIIEYQYTDYFTPLNNNKKNNINKKQDNTEESQGLGRRQSFLGLEALRQSLKKDPDQSFSSKREL